VKLTLEKTEKDRWK